MDALDLRIRNHVYSTFVGDGRAQTTAETAAALRLAEGEVAAAYRRLHDAHALVLHPGTDEIRMLNPFSAVETPHRVEAGGRSWFANCAWDAFGILAAFDVDGHITSSCLDCGEPIEIDVVDRRPEPADDVFHVLVPARSWWDDIVFT